MNTEDIKNNMIPDEIKDICRSCESNIFAQNKGCAFRSLGNEYCDYVLEATKIYLDKQQELDKYKNIVDELERWLKDKSKGRLEYTNYDGVLNKLKELRGFENE